MRKYEESMEKSIGRAGSIALLCNNISGPAFLGLPKLVASAGIVPVVLVIVLVCICASFNGTFLADSISSLPRNQSFSRPIMYSTAFEYIVGRKSYWFIEILFLISCFVQACSAIVVTSQSIDQFFASFLLGESYGLQLYPTINFIVWSPVNCISAEDDTSTLMDCSPFQNSGTLVLTAGYLVTTVLFLPFGRGNFKEAILVQLISFGFLIVLVLQFFNEFHSRGYPYLHTVPWVGGNFSQLAGVVLFNYAFVITVPSWLSEKKESVPVSRTIWTSTVLCTVMYIIFAILGAASFDEKGSNLLVLLASKKVSLFTRLCSALFGVLIIGCGIPIFCIMIRNSLYHAGVLSYKPSFFIGALLPYLLSWLLYQGNALMHLLAWTGLLVNGLVAFILPLVLSLVAMNRAVIAPVLVEEESDEWEKISTTCISLQQLEPNVYKEEEAGLLETQTNQSSYATIPPPSEGNFGHDQQSSSSMYSRFINAFLIDSRVKSLFTRDTVRPLFAFLVPYKKLIIELILSFFCIIILSNIILVLYFGVPLDEEAVSDFDEASLSTALLASSLAGFYQYHMIR